LTTTNKKAGKFINGKPFAVEDQLTVEEALQININGMPYTVAMRTPGDDDALCRGLLFTEKVYSNLEEPYFSQSVKDRNTNIIVGMDILIDKNLLGKDIDQNRTILSGSSCGVCGKRMIEDIQVNEPPVYSNLTLEIQLLAKMLAKMEQSQETFNLSGGSHASAAFTIGGELICIREDIGRHNAVDKVIGQLIIDKQLQKAAVMLVSGRLSYEIVTKTFRAGIPFLVAVSAPSSLAVEAAQSLGITLIGFCRKDQATVYSHENRVYSKTFKHSTQIN
jgi:FdhD protein